jgi:hypothetical protein
VSSKFEPELHSARSSLDDDDNSNSNSNSSSSSNSHVLNVDRAGGAASSSSSSSSSASSESVSSVTNSITSSTNSESSDVDDRDVDEVIDAMMRREAERQEAAARRAPTPSVLLATMYTWFKSNSAINLLSALAVTLSVSLVWYNSNGGEPCFDSLSMFLGGFVTLTGLIALMLFIELVMKCVVGFEIVVAINTPRLMCACFVVGVKVACIVGFLFWSALGVVYIADATSNDDCTFSTGVLWAFCLQLIVVLICCCTTCFATYRICSARRRRVRLNRVRPLIPIKPQPYRPHMFQDTEDAQCAICLDPYVDGNMIQRCPCNHFFHVDCINTWLGRSHLCPMCQKPIVDADAAAAHAAAAPNNAGANAAPAAAIVGGGVAAGAAGGGVQYADDSFSDTF